MAKIVRKIQKLFGSTAGANKIGVFGSLAAGAVAYATDPATIQSLPNFLTGWFGAVIGGNSPCIEDENALAYLWAYQLAYVMQAGVPEWEVGTTYYIGSLVNDGTGGIYASLTDTNVGNALTSTANWRPAGGRPLVVTAPASPYTIVAADYGKVFNTTTVSAAVSFTLPAASAGYQVTIKDVGGNAAYNTITVTPPGAVTIEGLNAAYVCEVNWGEWTFVSDGTNWFLN